MKRFLSLTLALALIMSVFTAVTTVTVSAEIDRTQKELKLWYNKEAPLSAAERGTDSIYAENGNPYKGVMIAGEDYRDCHWFAYPDDGWEAWSLPIGNGLMGVSTFGRTGVERLQITEPTLFNPFPNGFGNFSETYIDFGHTNVTNYERSLDINNAIANVKYTSGGVNYEREMLTSYPDKVFAVKLTASGSGNLNFTLRPTIPHIDQYSLDGTVSGGQGKNNCSVVAVGDTITLSGKMNYFSHIFEGQYKVILPGGGSMVADNPSGGLGGQIKVTGANEAIILVTIGTNYELKPIVFSGAPSQKLAGNAHPHDKLVSIISAAATKGYDAIKTDHIADYKKYFERVNFDLGGTVPTVTTDVLLGQYKKTNSDAYDKYLEELFFQYGRYLLISSSREGGIPAGVQGIWNRYERAPWSGGHWHNINIQVTYWAAMAANLTEMYIPYEDYSTAYMPYLRTGADEYIGKVNPSAKSPNGQNGWAIGTGGWPQGIEVVSTTSHSGPGTGGYVAGMFWDYYQFTKDPAILTRYTYPALSEMSLFYSKAVVPFDDKLLIEYSYSPEQYYTAIGCAFDQQMIYDNYINTQRAAEELGNTTDPVLAVIDQQLDKLDPVIVGSSGQVKEFREENYYGEFGEYTHRHTAQLAGLYPGTVINSKTPAWMDAAKVSLKERGPQYFGWAVGYQQMMWARAKEANKAYDEYKRMLTVATLTNLWTGKTGPPFQTDGNFSAVTAVTEMLVQSQDGFIEPMAAIPDSWATGSYSGLLARGNFEVSAQWANSQAQTFEIKSNKGGECAIKYYNIENATITPSVTLTKSKDMITFNSTAGTTYTITNIPPFTKVANPAFSGKGLTVSPNYKRFTLQWEESPDAIYYNVYRAVESAPDYELLETNVINRNRTYTVPDELFGKQVTYKIAAVAANGRESSGITKTMAVATEKENQWVKVWWSDYESINYINGPGAEQPWENAWNMNLYYQLWQPGKQVGSALEYTFTGTGARMLRSNSNWGPFDHTGMRFYLDGDTTPYAIVQPETSKSDSKVLPVGEITDLPKQQHTVRVEFFDGSAASNAIYFEGFEYLPDVILKFEPKASGEFIGNDLQITAPYANGATLFNFYKKNKDSGKYEKIASSPFEAAVIKNADNGAEYGASAMVGVAENDIMPVEIEKLPAERLALIAALTDIAEFYDYSFPATIGQRFDKMVDSVRTVLGSFDATQGEVDAATVQIAAFLDTNKLFIPYVRSVTVGASDVTVILRSDSDLIGKQLILAFYNGDELLSSESKTIDGTFSAKFAKPAAYTKTTRIRAFVWEGLRNLLPYGINYSG